MWAIMLRDVFNEMVVIPSRYGKTGKSAVVKTDTMYFQLEEGLMV